MCASSSRALQAILELHPIAGQLILAACHRPPQALRHIRHKAERQLVRDQPFHQPLGIGEVSLPAVRPLIRLRLREMQRAGRGPGVRPGASRRLPVALQRRPTPAASTARSIPSPLPRPRARPTTRRARAVGSGVVPNCRRSNTYSPSTSTSATTTANIRLCTSIPAIRYGIRLSWRERRTCLGCLTQGHGLSSPARRPLIRSSAHVPDHPIHRRQLLHWFDRSRRSRRHHSRNGAPDFHPISRADVSAWERAAAAQ